MTKIRGHGLALLAVLGLLGQGHAYAQVMAPAPLPVADFFRMPLVARPALSPSGRYLAFALTQGEARTVLAMLDLDVPGPPKPIGYFRDSDVNRIWWVNDERLVFDALDRKPRRDDPVWPGLWAVNRDGSDYRVLIRPDMVTHVGTTRLNNERALDWNWRMYATVGDGSGDVIVAQHEFSNVWEPRNLSLSRLDTRSGLRTPLTEGAPPNTLGWALDGNGIPVLATSIRDGRYAIHRRVDVQQPWQLWHEGEAFTGDWPDVLWVGAQRELYLSIGTSSGTAALHRVPLEGKLADAKALIKLDGYDFNGRVQADEQSRRVLGVHFETDAPGTVWFDEGMKTIQSVVDQALPSTVNTLDCRRCETSARVLITAQSDRQPTLYYIYHRDSKKISPLLASRPWLRGKPMGERDVQRFAARDGLPIPTLVTKPAGAKGPQPAVVLVHGGPYVRGHGWTWEPEAQFLASRGYVVIEPEFRGSMGHGFKHFRAGWKQWGLAMQDDLADSVDWAVKQGWVDPKRVCIAGASYGGYAALMGLVRHHDKYQCAINWVGVTDIALMYKTHWDDSNEQWRRYGMPQLVGDPVKDAEQLKATSPVQQASKVRRPVLMAYGTDDYRVPIKHGSDFRDAVAVANRDVEWVTYADEGHGWLMQETRVDFWTRVEKFLGRHIGGAAPGR